MPRARHKTLRELGEIPDLLTPGQAAELLQVHVMTVRTWMRKGRIPHQKFGGSYRIPKDALLAYRPPDAGRTPKPHVAPPRPRDSATASEAIATLTNAEAAELLGISRATIERWVRAGRVTTIAIGANKGKRRIVHDERFDLLRAQRGAQ